MLLVRAQSKRERSATEKRSHKILFNLLRDSVAEYL